MTITRAQTESMLIRRCGGLMTACGLDGTTVSGANADLNDPIGSALRQLGYAVATPTAVADSDLSALSVDDMDALLDYAELRALQSAQGNLDLVDLESGTESGKYDQLSKRLDSIIARKIATITKLYGIGASRLEDGLIDLAFQQLDPNTD